MEYNENNINLLNCLQLGFSKKRIYNGYLFYFKGVWQETTANLLSMAKTNDIIQRFDGLNTRYLRKCLTNENE